jgi:hypothetical protein
MLTVNIEDFTSARWIAIVGGVVLMSTCAALALLLILLNSAYGGETVRLRNPLAPPAAPVTNNTDNSETQNNAPNNTGSNNTSGAQTTNPSNPVAGTSQQATAYLPQLNGYSAVDTNSVTEALTFITGSADFLAQAESSAETFSAQSLSGIATTLIVSQLDEFIDCYLATGAVDARIYIKYDVQTLVSGGVPPMGAVVVANQDQLVNSLMACAVSPNDPNSFSAQSANQPCGSVGNFSAAGDTFTYLYAGSGTEFCNAVAAHFGTFGG